MIEHSHLKKYEMSATMNGSDIYFMKILNPKYYIPYHWHDGIEILYNLTGIHQIILKNKTIELHENDLFLINSRTLHATRSSKNNSIILIELPYSFLKKYIPDIDSITYDINPHSQNAKIQTKLSQLKKIIFDMDVIMDIKPDSSNLRLNSLTFEMLFQLQHNFKVKTPKRCTNTQQKNAQRLSLILDYVYEHYTEPISIAEISSYVHLQPQYFCRFFKENMGKTFLDFLNEVRLYYTYQDIINTSIPITEIIAKNGFSTYATFRKLFISKFSCTPSTLRKTHPDLEMEFLVTE